MSVVSNVKESRKNAKPDTAIQNQYAKELKALKSKGANKSLATIFVKGESCASLVG